MISDGATSDIEVSVVDVPWPDRCLAGWARTRPRPKETDGLWEPPCAQCVRADECFTQREPREAVTG